jgi:stage V sporulation protein SpoVS
MSPNKWQFEHMRKKVEEGDRVPGGTLKLVKVSSRSSPFRVAGAIANLIREKNDVIVQAIGYEAVYITVKSVIYATDYLAIDDKIHILSKLEFVNIESGDILCVRFTIRVLPNFLVYEDSVETGLHEEDLF